jgi:hypothetical protein
VLTNSMREVEKREDACDAKPNQPGLLVWDCFGDDCVRRRTASARRRALVAERLNKRSPGCRREAVDKIVANVLAKDLAA